MRPTHLRKVFSLFLATVVDLFLPPLALVPSSFAVLATFTVFDFTLFTTWRATSKVDITTTDSFTETTRRR